MYGVCWKTYPQKSVYQAGQLGERIAQLVCTYNPLHLIKIRDVRAYAVVVVLGRDVNMAEVLKEP